MLRSKSLLNSALLILISYGATWGRATTLMALWCSKMSSRLSVDDPLRVACGQFKDPEEYALKFSPCELAIATSSPEHLTLLSYSSGHFMETVAILTGAAILKNAEDLAFLRSLHLNDRGSPAACRDIDDAHYCIVQPPVPVSLGLCVPRVCDSASVSKLLGNFPSKFHDSRYTPDTFPGYGPPSIVPTVICGDESRLSINVGTICTLVAVGCLVALIVVGTGLDYWRQHQRDMFSGKAFERAEGRMTLVDDPRDGHQKAKLLPEPDITNGDHDHVADEDYRNMPPRLLGLDDEIPHSVMHQDKPEHEEKDGTPSCIESAESHGINENSVLESNEDSGKELVNQDSERELLLHPQVLVATPFQSRILALTQLVIRREYKDAWWWECMECFSLRVNVDKLLSPSQSSNLFAALDGVRSLSILWVILGHVLILSAEGAGLTNFINVLPVDGHGVLSRLTGQVFPSAFLAVDSFFLMSGFLLSVVLLPKIKSSSMGNGLQILRIYLHRYLRLTPTVFFITLVRWQLLPLLSDSPTWWPAASMQRDRCTKLVAVLEAFAIASAESAVSSFSSITAQAATASIADRPGLSPASISS